MPSAVKALMQSTCTNHYWTPSALCSPILSLICCNVVAVVVLALCSLGCEAAPLLTFGVLAACRTRGSQTRCLLLGTKKHNSTSTHTRRHRQRETHTQTHAHIDTHTHANARADTDVATHTAGTCVLGSSVVSTGSDVKGCYHHR